MRFVMNDWIIIMSPHSGVTIFWGWNGGSRLHLSMEHGIMFEAFYKIKNVSSMT